MDYLLRRWTTLASPVPHINVISRAPGKAQNHGTIHPSRSRARPISTLHARRVNGERRIERRLYGNVSSRHASTIITRLLERQTSIKTQRDAIRSRHRTEADLRKQVRLQMTSHHYSPATAFYEQDSQLWERQAKEKHEISEEHHQLHRDEYRQKVDEKELFEMIAASSKTVHLSNATKDALLSASNNRSTLAGNSNRLSRLGASLDKVRTKARQALCDAGLEHYEHDVQKLKREIDTVLGEVTILDSRLKASLIALYSSMAKDVHDMKDLSLKDQPISAAVADLELVNESNRETIEVIQDKYDRARQVLNYTSKTLDWFGDEYSSVLQEKIQNLLDELDPNLERMADDIRTAAGVEYFKRWQDRIKRLRHIEELFIKRRQIAIVERIKERALNDEVVSPDTPEYLADRPSDGETESMGPKFIELERIKFTEIQPSISRWIQELDDDQEDPQGTPIRQLYTGNMSIDSINPWDSESCAMRLPMRRKRIDNYQGSVLD